MPKDTKPVKKPAGNTKQACEFIRDHVCLRLVRSGWSEDKAAAMVASVSDQEILQLVPPEKMQGLGDGRFLNWLETNGPKLLNAVDKIFTLLSLFTEKPKAESESGEETEEETEETEEEESEDEEEEEEE